MVELGLFQWLVGGIVAMGLALFAYLNGRVTNVHSKQQEFRTFVAETYSTKGDVKNVEQQLTHSLDRVHGRIDDVDKNIRELPRQILEQLKDR